MSINGGVHFMLYLQYIGPGMKFIGRKEELKLLRTLFDKPTFLGNLKNAWDMEFSSNPNLILILCGSVSSWIEKNIVNSTGFVGRPSLYLTLEELPLSDCNLFWDKLG